jgi:LPS-assembly lipoprotein
MWSPNPRTLLRLVPALVLAGMSAGCFQPLYGVHASAPGTSPTVGSALAAVQVEPLNTPRGTRLDRVGVEVRNGLIYNLTGGSGGAAPTHKLYIELDSRQQNIIVDIRTGRSDVQTYGIDARYRLVDLATNKTVVNSATFARVSFNIPGQQQRFAGERGLRDAEDRAAAEIADNIRNRLASYFTAGT